MKKVYVYYESYLKNSSLSTNVEIEVFENYNEAHCFMLSRRDEILKNSDFVLDKRETGDDKSWLRILIGDNYLDLIIEEKELHKKM